MDGRKTEGRIAGALPKAYALRALVCLASFVLVALLLSVQMYASSEAEGREADFGRIAAFQLTVWGSWAVLTPLIVAATRRWPVRAEVLLRGLALHAALGCGFLVSKTLIDVALTSLLLSPPQPPPMEGPPPGTGPPPAMAGPPSPVPGPPPSFRRPPRPPGARPPAPGDSQWLLGRVLFGLGPNLAAYVAIVGVCHAIDYYRKYRQRELAATRLEAQLAGARLEALEMQLRPHFLFNTLNGISTLVRSDPALAERMIASLGELLRAVLRRSGAQEVPLAEELGLLGRYLDIVRMRYRDRLEVEIDAAPGAGGILVPTLILQPLVENAVEHGVARRTGPGRIRIAVEERTADAPPGAPSHGVLRLVVADDGPGLPPEGLAEGGVGLLNTRERLRALYGSAARVELSSREGDGTTVTLEIPARQAGGNRAGVGKEP